MPNLPCAYSDVAKFLQLAGHIRVHDYFTEVFERSIRVFQFFKFLLAGHNQQLGGPVPYHVVMKSTKICAKKIRSQGVMA